jgi:hypothetical protein
MCMPILCIESASVKKSFGGDVRFAPSTLMMLVRQPLKMPRKPSLEGDSVPENMFQTLTIFFSHYNSCAVFYALRRQGRPVKIRRGPATVMATKAATQVTVS